MKGVIYSKLITASTLNGNTVHIICISAVITDRILALVLSFVFLFCFTQVRFNFIDDVISLSEVG